MASAKAILPRKATLDASRVAFLIRLRPLPGFFRTYCLFDAAGGELRRHGRRPAGASSPLADHVAESLLTNLGISSNG